ncbi:MULTISPECIES: RNA polymerase sigma factor [unclassified Lentimonas]|uniref:RNA polymerase sigma factor n=1 Tax=unclassified Lentimonas TaxID=2630993 RepID=UPI0013896605|nr:MULTISPECIES: sigma-70 family RNA polymerase sigma factor [unclassified Lentimonas]
MSSSGTADEATQRVQQRRLIGLFHDLESPLLGFAHQMVKNEQLAQDVVQEAFLRLQKNLAEVEHPKAWLYTTVRRLAIDSLRKSSKVVPFPRTEDAAEVEPEDPSPSPDELSEIDERTGLMRVCIERLKPRDQHLVRLKFIDNLSYKQISERMGMTVSNVGYSLHHALKSLELELNKEGITQ